jgi:uncharacterized repeat protein (TIGR01451 family)
VALLVTLVAVAMISIAVVGAQEFGQTATLATDGEAGTTLTASKTAEGFSEQMLEICYDMDKTALTENLELKRGQEGNISYQINVTKEIKPGDAVSYGVRGYITVKNCGEVPTENLTLTDYILYQTGGGPFQVLTSFNVDVSVKPILQPGETYIYSYSHNFMPVADAAYKNRVNVTITNHSGHLGEPFGPSPAADFSLPEEPDFIGPAPCKAIITDFVTMPPGFQLMAGPGGPWEFTENGTVQYNITIKNVAAEPNQCFDVINLANMTRCDGCQCENDTTTVPVCTPCHPSISIEKGGPDCVVVGDDIVWTFSIHNDGIETLYNVTVVDPPVSVTVPIGTLAPGEYYNFTYVTVAEAPGEAYNYAYVTGESICGIEVNETDDHTVMVINPGMSFEKGGPNCVFVGDDIVWTFAVQNTGDVNLSNVVLTDPPVGQVIPYTDNGGILEPGMWWNLTYTTTASQAGEAYNYAYVTADTECQVKLNETDDHTVMVYNIPSMTFEKGGPECVFVGDDIVWTFSIHNDGLETLNNVTVVDPPVGETIAIGTLAPGEYANFTYTTVAAEPGEVTNYAYVTADGPCSSELNVTDDHTVTIYPRPSISFEKGGPDCVFVGDDIVWTFTIQNDGPVTLTDVTIIDPPVGETIAIGILEPGQWANLTYTTTAGAKGEVTDYAYVTAIAPCGAELNVTDDHTVIICEHPSITFEKGGPDCVVVGDDIVWTFTIHNDGVETLTDVTIVDPPVGETIVIGTLEPGQWANLTYTTVAIEAGEVTNYAYVTANGPCGSTLNVTDDHTVKVCDPAIALEKGGPVEIDIGETIVWTFNVQNIGADPLTNVTLIDPYLGITGEVYPDNGGILEPGMWWNFTKTSIADVLEPITNVAYIEADGCCGTTLNVSDDHTVDVKPGDPPRINIALEKGGPDAVSNGSSIVWTFKVTNIGNETLSNVSVVDPFFGETFEYVGELAAGESWEFTYTTIAEIGEGFICNNATAYGSAFGLEVNATDDHCVEVKECIINCMEVTKTGPEEANPGDTITYTITVKNISDSPLVNIHVVDPMLGLDEWIWCLAPCETATFTIDYKIPCDWNWCDNGEWLNNTVYVDGWCCANYCYEEASWSVHVNVCCIIEVEKFAPSEAAPGQTITYEIIVKNVGKCRLICVELTDELLGIYDMELGDLDPCESVTLTFTYTVPADWNYCDDGEKLCNKVFVDGFCCCCDKWVDDKDWAKTYIDVCCILVVDKQANKRSAVPGETIMYTITVSNKGLCPIGCIDVVDSTLGWSTYIPCLCSCESKTFFINYTVPADWHYCSDGDMLVNTATATGWCCGERISDSDSWSVYIDDPYDIEVVKRGPDYAYPGQTIIFEITVWNAGYSGLACIDVWDPTIGFFAEIEYLPSCEMQTFSVPYTIPSDWCTVTDGQWFYNTVYVEGWCEANNATDQYTETTRIHDMCAIDIRASGPSEICPENWIDYTFSVTNIGNITLINATVWDSLTGFSEKICVLEPGETVEFTTRWWANVDPNCKPRMVTNNFWVEAYCCPCDAMVTDFAQVTTKVKGAEIDVWKTGPSNAEPGDTVTWTVYVQNLGCCDLECVQVWDNISGVTILNEVIETLPAGEMRSWEVSWTVPADWSNCEDGRIITNYVDARGFSCVCEDWVFDCDYEDLYIYDWCDLRVEKNIVMQPGNGDAKCLPDMYYPGDTIWYEIVVKNHGINPITCINVWDPAIGWDAQICCLLPCESETFYVPYWIPCWWNYCEDGEWFNNTVYAEGWCCDELVSAEDSASAFICTCCSIDVFKVGPETATPGETITYEISVHNTGKMPICCIKVVDVLTAGGFDSVILRDLDFDSMPCDFWFGAWEEIDCLMPCEWYNFTVTFTVPEDWTYCCNGDKLYNFVGVLGQCCFELVWDLSCWETDIIDIPPTIMVEKEKCGLDMAKPGDWITYRITVKNPNEYALSCVHIVDELLGIDEYICCILPCDSVTKYYKYQVPEDWSYCENGIWLNNTVFVEGYYFDQYVSDSDMEDVRIYDCCDLRITKTANVETAEPGDVIEYTITVKNYGEKPICCIDVLDPMLKLRDKIPCLLPCEEVTYVIEYMVPMDWCYCSDGDWLNNTVSARGWCCEYSVEESAFESVFIENEANLRVWKTANVKEANVGDTVSFTITVMNCGSKSFGCVKVTDELLGIYDLDIGCLAPCERWTQTYRYTIPENYTFCEDKWLNNTVYACSYMMDVFVEDEDTASVLVLAPCKISVVKEERTGRSYPGDWLIYDIFVSNVGSHPVEVRSITDESIGYWNNDSFMLDPGEQRHVIAEYRIPDEFICEPYLLVNHVVVTACCCCEPDCCCIITAEDTFELTVRPQCEIEVFKEAPATAVPGETITYSITVRNIGIVDLYRVTINDTLLGISELIIGPLKPGESNTTFWKYTVPMDWAYCTHGDYLVNTVDVRACCEWCTCFNTTDVTTQILYPPLRVFKEGPAEANPGDEVTYTISVHNTGKAPICCLKVFDRWMGQQMLVGEVMCLMPCEWANFTVTMVVPDPWPYCAVGEFLVDRAFAMGWACGRQVTAQDVMRTKINCDFQIGIWKEDMSCFDIAWPGDTIWYTIVVKNLGMKDLNNVNVVDELVGLDVLIDCLNPCEMRMFRVSFTVPMNWSYCESGMFLENVAWVEAWGCGDRYYAESSDTTLIMDAYHVEVEKVGPEEACPGDTVEFTITVSNVGWSTIACLRVVDPLVGLDEMIWCLAPCENVTFTVQYTIPEDWSYCYDGEYLINEVYVYGVGCYSMWTFLECPMVCDYSMWMVYIPVSCCPYQDGPIPCPVCPA